MMRKVFYFLLGATFGIFSVVFVTQNSVFLVSRAEATDISYSQLSLFGDIFERVRAQYVEQPEDKQLIESALNGMLTSLDPHSSFLSSEELSDMREGLSGKFGGLGIKVTMEDGLVKVIAPIDDTPAAKAGVQAGDLITHLDGEPVRGLKLSEAVKKMRGEVDTEIEITVLRKEADAPLKIKIVRGVITDQSVRHEVIDDTGYIRVMKFNNTTYSGLEKAIKTITKEVPEEQLKGIVIDLRNNPGGVLDQAIAVSDAFLDRGEIVSTRGRNPDDDKRYNAKADDIDKLVNKLNVIVLINGGSASASEIVAGALRDQARATLIGTKTFGKGSVQTIFNVREDAAIRLTTARYYTPSGVSIQARGISPDIKVEPKVPEEFKGRDIVGGEATLRGHLENSDEENDEGSSGYVPAEREDDIQLLYAIDLLSGKEKHEKFPPAQGDEAQ